MWHAPLVKYNEKEKIRCFNDNPKKINDIIQNKQNVNLDFFPDILNCLSMMLRWNHFQ